jgi:hypothetical protein
VRQFRPDRGGPQGIAEPDGRGRHGRGARSPQVGAGERGELLDPHPEGGLQRPEVPALLHVQVLVEDAGLVPHDELPAAGGNGSQRLERRSGNGEERGRDDERLGIE